MASPTPKPRSSVRSQPLKPSGRPPQQASSASDASPVAVDPIWLLKAVSVIVVASMICGYLTLCLLFYQGQWQLVLHPSRSTPAPVSLEGAPVQTIRFGIDETATPQLTGWLIPAESSARYAAYTVLYLPSGDGSLADNITPLVALHETGINVFAFDYRGYGQSAATRPNQKRMTQDAASAWQYLTVSRALAPSHIILFGDGIGCALAAQLAADHPEAPAVILDSPRPDVIQTILADPRTKSLPVRVLFHEEFEITATVSNLKTPKLFLFNSQFHPADATAVEIDRLTSASAEPKMFSTLLAQDFYGPLYREQIARFLDQYLK